MGKRKGIKKPLVDEEDASDTDIEDVNMEAVTDSDEEYTEAEKKLLEKVRKKRTPENFDSDDEVYELQGEDEDEEEKEEEEEEEEEDDLQDMESDIEELQEDDDIPNDRAWGKEGRNFYSSDYKYTDYSSATQKDFANAEMEEQEAKKLHIRSADEIFDIVDDRFMQIIQDSKDDNQKDSELNLEFSKSDKKRQLMLTKRESKVFTALVTDFKERIIEVKEILAPFLKLVENGMFPECNAVTYVKTKYDLVLNYCVNIVFYLMLKAKGLPARTHPVIKRLEQYRQLLGQLQSREGNLLREVAETMKAIKEGKPLYNIDDSQKSTKKKISRFDSLSKKLTRRKETDMVQEEQELSSNSMDMDSMAEESMDEDNFNAEEKYDDKDKGDEDDKDVADEQEGKRAITYQIAKNRGLTPYRKELRNPRVKHRNKYRKAKIRRKGAVREVRKELTRYAGEISGIKAGVKKGIKLK